MSMCFSFLTFRRFGFPNKQALSEGRTGTECRGEEHDVTVIWSIASGKRQISMDTREIHYSSSRAGLLDFSWTTKGNHVIKVVCHAAAPLSPIPGFRQYDLYIDGQSFFTMPKVYELGIKGPIPPHARVPGYGYSNPTSPISMDSGYPRSVGGGDYVPLSREQEEADLRRAIQASLEESRRHLENKGQNGGALLQTSQSSGDGDLLDFGSPAPTGPPGLPMSDNRSVSGMSYYSAPPSYSQAPALPYGSPPPYNAPPVNPGALVPSHGPPGYYQAPPTTPAYASPPPGSYASPPPGAYASLPPGSYASPPPGAYASPPPVPPAPAPTPQTGYAPSPYGAPQMNYMNAPGQQSYDTFGLNSTPEDDPFAPKPPPPPPQQDFASMILGAYQNGQSPNKLMSGPQQNGSSPHAPQMNGGGPAQSMNALAIAVEEEEPVNELEKAMKNLVNIDRIDEPAEGEVKLTMIKKEEAKKKMHKGKSVPLPPAGKDIAGSNASLAQIRDVGVSGSSF